MQHFLNVQIPPLTQEGGQFQTLAVFEVQEGALVFLRPTGPIKNRLPTCFPPCMLLSQWNFLLSEPKKEVLGMGGPVYTLSFDMANMDALRFFSARILKGQRTCKKAPA